VRRPAGRRAGQHLTGVDETPLRNERCSAYRLAEARTSRTSSTGSSSWISTLTPIHPRSWPSVPTPAGNLLEVIWLELADDVELVIHAMDLQPVFYDLLPTREDPTP
jgi:hypothetical protein